MCCTEHRWRVTVTMNNSPRTAEMKGYISLPLERLKTRRISESEMETIYSTAHTVFTYNHI